LGDNERINPGQWDFTILLKNHGLPPFIFGGISPCPKIILPYAYLLMVSIPRLLFLALTALPTLAEASLYDSIKTKLSGDSGVMTQADFERMAIQIRERAIQQTRQPVVTVPTSAPVGFGKYGWHRNIQTTFFWVGERPTARNPVPNTRSAWDANWYRNFGGYDNPDPRARRNYIPIGFTPRQNPFYIALPYCDVSRGNTKPEAKKVIPWFRECFEKEGKTVLKGRWIAIHHGGKTCFAQWEDCGPFRTDHYQYVFGNERPRPNLNHGAGLDISPAVRDYLGMGKNDVCDWKFVDSGSVPDGPWKYYGDNNTFVLLRKGLNLFERDRNNARRSPSVNSTIRPSSQSVPLNGSSTGVRVSPTVGIQN